MSAKDENSSLRSIIKRTIFSCLCFQNILQKYILKSKIKSMSNVDSLLTVTTVWAVHFLFFIKFNYFKIFTTVYEEKCFLNANCLKIVSNLPFFLFIKIIFKRAKLKKIFLYRVSMITKD